MYIPPPTRIAWHHFQFTLPREWEMTGHSLRPEAGRMAFATGAGVQGQLAWRVVKAVPDMPRILAEIHHRRLKTIAPSERAGHSDTLEVSRVGEFHVAHERAGQQFYASAFFPSTRAMIEWVFPAFDPELLHAVIAPMLKGTRPNSGEVRAWAAFGLELRLPAEYAVAEVHALPANVTLVFLNRKHHRIVAHRLGLPAENLNGEDLPTFYTRCLAAQHARVSSARPADWRGRPGVEAEFRMRGRRGFDLLLGPWWRGNGMLYHDPDEKRLYAFEQVGPRRMKRLPFEEIVVDSARGGNHA